MGNLDGNGGLYNCRNMLEATNRMTYAVVGGSNYGQDGHDDDELPEGSSDDSNNLVGSRGDGDAEESKSNKNCEGGKFVPDFGEGMFWSVLAD